MARQHRLRAHRWDVTADAVDAFVAAYGRIPRAAKGASGSERRLAYWLHYQRRSATRDNHTDQQRRRLSRIHGFTWNPREARWHATLGDLRSFYAQNCRGPRYRSSEQDERALANWEAKQVHLLRRGQLDESRSRAFSEFISSAGSRAGTCVFQQRNE
jgi:hypothetical protein